MIYSIVFFVLLLLVLVIYFMNDRIKFNYIARKEYDQRYINRDRKGVEW